MSAAGGPAPAAAGGEKTSSWDYLMYYDTPKVVRIQDKGLGALYLFMCFGVMCYVVLYQIIYLNEHFASTPVTGVGRLVLRPPTKGCDPLEPDCDGDFRPLTEVPYCTQYTGSEPALRQRVCTYYDAQELTGSGTLVAGQLLIPTRIGTVFERRACEASEANGWSCKALYKRLQQDANTTERYVGDIDRYSVVLSHVFHSEQHTGNSVMYRGTYRTCERPEAAQADEVLSAARFFRGRTECDGGQWKVTPVECEGTECGWLRPLTQEEEDCEPDQSFLAQRSEPAVDVQETPEVHEPTRARLRHKRRKRRFRRGSSLLQLDQKQEPFGPPPAGPRALVAAPAPAPGIHATKHGDVFTIADLLELAGSDLDGGDGKHHSHNQDCAAFRDAGIIVEIEARYTNLAPWVSSFRSNDDSHVQYQYQVRARPVGEIEAAQLAAAQPPDFPETRAIEHRHGIYLTLKVTGEFGEFSVVYFLVMLTTSLTLLAVVAKLVDFLAIYVLAHRGEYYTAKYQETKVDSSDKFFDKSAVTGALGPARSPAASPPPSERSRD